MSFGRRLALFFILIAILPTLALVGILLIVSEDSRRGKADARLAAGLETALALYEGQVDEARTRAVALARSPGLASGLRREDEAGLSAFASKAARSPDVVAVEVQGPDGDELAEAGRGQAIAFAQTRLMSGGEPSGILLVSTTTASEYGTDVRRLTKREVTVSRGETVLTSTVAPQFVPIERGGTVDLELPEGEFRAHLLELDPVQQETLLLLGPRKEGGLLSVDRPVGVLLTAFLLLGLVFAYMLARALTGLHLQVSEQAMTDPLTGLSNRRRMHQQLNAEGARAKRFGHRISALIVDIDDFKQINDERGHQQGDTVLQTIAEIVRRSTRLIDITARYGGDELAIVLLETDADGAMVLAQRLRERIAHTEIPLRDGQTIKVTVSIGAATIPDSAPEVDDLIEAADQALLKGKRSGKNRVAEAPKVPKPSVRSG